MYSGNGVADGAGKTTEQSMPLSSPKSAVTRLNILAAECRQSVQVMHNTSVNDLTPKGGGFLEPFL